MRDIKFRSWDNHRKEYLSAGKVFIPIYPSRAPKTCKELNLDTSNFLCAHGRMVLEQFIGFQDINGKDIYEGDVLHKLDPAIWNPFTVEYSDQSASFIAGGLISRVAIKESELVIVGNIHENPEIFTQK